MIYCFSKSAKGYSHLKTKKPCQDYSFSACDNERCIIACCDGHGGDKYIRSQRGSKIACLAIYNVFSKIRPMDLKKLEDEEYLDNLKLAILCEWNRLVEIDISNNPISSYELKDLNEDDAFEVRQNKIKAYGTTLSGAMLCNHHLIVVSIGDSEPFLVRKGKLERVFENDSDPVGNVTYSLCQENAYDYMKIKNLNFDQYDGLFLTTDGLTSPYQSYDNFEESFIQPMMKKIVVDNDIRYVDNFIEDLASRLGVGDDVSIAFLINSKYFKKYYE